MSDELLGRLPMFQNLSDDSRRALDAQLEEVHVARGDVLFTAGDAADGLYVLLRGKVKMTRPSRRQQQLVPPTRRVRTALPAPRESLLSLIGPGEVFGELSLMDGGRRSTTARAMLDCELRHVPGPAIKELVATRHDVALAMLAQMTHRVRVSNDVISGLVLSDVPGRLARLLLTLSERFGEQVDGGVEVHHDLTQAELAQMVGASRETVNKVLTDFATRKWISMSGKTVLIREPGRLAARID